ncbi:MAG TPA: TetR/AcrR family transcriptional regulator [candidate division Zixibacteria bacterium]|nr:TetR/AcrR family transcriptional regulator [candidate division Zixibacteria bacterium]
MSAIPEPRPDLRRERGDRTRQAILESAARLSSVEGLEGLSIGRLAEHLGMSKSGLYAHFRSKEELQLATVRTAQAMYDEAIMQPALREPAGVRRVLRFADLYLDYLRDGPFLGGCFFIAAYLDPARNRGPVRDALVEIQAGLLRFFTDAVAAAQSAGEVPDGTAPHELAFTIDAILVGADLNFVLFHDPAYLEMAKDALRRALGQPARPSPDAAPVSAAERGSAPREALGSSGG